MQDWHFVAQGVRDNVALILIILIVGGFLAGWLLFQTFLSAGDRGEIARLRRKMRDLEVERAHAYSSVVRPPAEVLVDPVVLTPRWVRKGGAGTTSDGGCLVIVDDTVAPAKTAVVTVRIDGLPVHTRQSLRSGHTLKAEGNLGTYTVQVSAVEPLQAMIAVSLRNRHAQAAS